MIPPTTVGTLGMSFGWSVDGGCLGSLSLWSLSEPGIASGQTTETGALLRCWAGCYTAQGEELIPDNLAVTAAPVWRPRALCACLGHHPPVLNAWSVNL